jgi:N-ATPase, AtpR subunit
MSAALWLMAGVVGGVVHFSLLNWSVRHYLGRAGLVKGLGLQAARLAATGLLLFFSAWHGAMPLLCAGLGVMVARSLVVCVTRVAS